MPNVLILTSDVGEDPCVVSVCSALRAAGSEPLVVATRKFPAGVPIAFEPHGESSVASIAGVRAGDLRSVWIREMEPTMPDQLPPDQTTAGELQAVATLWSFLECLDVFQLDPPESLLSACHKPYQERLARRFGLDVPRSLVTNDPASLRSFARTCPGQIVCKLVESGSVGVRTKNGQKSFPTTLVTEEELADPVGLEMSPMIFQEYLPKALELRITVVGPEVFVAAIAPGDTVDWRTSLELVRGFRPYTELPTGVRRGLLALLDHLRLNFATADFVVTPDGRHVFLEINTISWFDHVERHAGLPISQAVAELLLGTLPPRVVDRPHGAGA